MTFASEMNTVELAVTCPVCLDQLSQATSVNSADALMPVPGDVTVCATCASVLEFGENLTTHQISTDGLDADIKEMIEQVAAFFKSQLVSKIRH